MKPKTPRPTKPEKTPKPTWQKTPKPTKEDKTPRPTWAKTPKPTKEQKTPRPTWKKTPKPTKEYNNWEKTPRPTEHKSNYGHGQWEKDNDYKYKEEMKKAADASYYRDPYAREYSMQYDQM